MCWKCDNPGGTAEGDLDGLLASVRAHGWAIKYVEDDRRPYAYTIGLHELGLPELLARGLLRSGHWRCLTTSCRSR
jgi:hypothetical protein